MFWSAPKRSIVTLKSPSRFTTRSAARRVSTQSSEDGNKVKTTDVRKHVERVDVLNTGCIRLDNESLLSIWKSNRTSLVQSNTTKSLRCTSAKCLMCNESTKDTFFEIKGATKVFGVSSSRVERSEVINQESILELIETVTIFDRQSASFNSSIFSEV